MRQELIKRYPDDEDLLEDVIIENKQAIEMCNIYSNVLSATMEALGSLISNNLNIVMKALTSITLVISVPTLIASLWGCLLYTSSIYRRWFAVLSYQLQLWR